MLASPCRTTSSFGRRMELPEYPTCLWTKPLRKGRAGRPWLLLEVGDGCPEFGAFGCYHVQLCLICPQ